MVRKGYDRLDVDEPDRMTKKIEFHMQKFEIVKAALVKAARERIEGLTR